MVAEITNAFSGFSADLTSIASVALPIAGGALLVWVGFRLARKLTNNGVGK
jgi:threonine/homoserine/homoserine lactone efflux protein